MTFQEAITRLQRQDDYLIRRISERQAESKPYHHQELDRDAIALAVSALRYVHELEVYEASHKEI